MKVIHYVANLHLMRGLERQALLQSSSLIENGTNCQLWTLTSYDSNLQNNSRRFLTKVVTLSPRYLPAKELFSFVSIFLA